MNLKTKKVLAREFLLLLAVFLLSFFAFLSTYGYNQYLKKQYDSLQDTVARYQSLSKSVSKEFYGKLQRQDQLYQTLNAYALPTFIEGNIFFPAIFQDRVTFFKTYIQFAKKEKINGKWKSYWSKEEKLALQKLGIDSPQKLKSYIMSNIHTADDIKSRDVAMKYETEIPGIQERASNLLRKQLNYKQQLRVGINSLMILLLGMFLLRYLIYGVLASIKVLKAN